MITLSRRQARRLRATFRRHALGLSARGPVPPLVLVAEPGAGLRVRHHTAALAVEFLLAGRFAPAEAIALPLDALADVEGPDDSPVVLEALGPGSVVARWDDRGVPQTRDYAVADPAGLPPFPPLPSRLTAGSAALLEALAEAGRVAGEDSPRYALGSIQLRGSAGEVVATDGRQVLVRSGLAMPWDDDLLVRPLPPFAARDLPGDRPVEVGRSGAHVVLRAGTFTLWLAVRDDARFPRVDGLLRDGDAAATTLHLDRLDAGFLAGALEALPGGDAANAPVTLDLNGAVAVRARPDEGGRATELVLPRSRYDGPPVRLATARAFLATALGLGLRELRLSGPSGPVMGREGGLAYAWQPLDHDSALPQADDAIRIEPEEGRAPVTSRPSSSRPTPTAHEARTRRPLAATVNPPAAPPAIPAPPASGLAGLIREAEALHEALADARGRSGRLVAALRKHRKQSRLVQETIRSLRELRLQGVAD